MWRRCHRSIVVAPTTAHKGCSLPGRLLASGSAWFEWGRVGVRMLRCLSRLPAAVFNATIVLAAAITWTTATPAVAADSPATPAVAADSPEPVVTIVTPPPSDTVDGPPAPEPPPPPPGPTLPLVIANGEFANLPLIFSQSCKVAGGTLTAGGCSFASLPNSAFGEASFITIAESLFEAHLRE